MRKSIFVGVLTIFGVVCSHAQTITIAGAGYWNPVPIAAAPGQVITLFVAGIGKSLTEPVRAKTTPLPISLAGISVTLRQFGDTPVPLFEVRPLSTCPTTPSAQNSCGPLVAVTIQIPYELQPPCLPCARPVPLSSQLLVTEDGSAGALIDLFPLDDQVHILTSCDLTVAPSATGVNRTGLPCPPLVTHADGTLVSALSPARPGEHLVAYASGLGQTDPPATTGQAASTAMPTIISFAINFNFALNALPAKPTPIPLAGEPTAFGLHPEFSGLTPGYVGLYQINFTVPSVPATLLPCEDPNVAPVRPDVVQSNLTVSFGSQYSFDGGGICVIPGG